MPEEWLWYWFCAKFLGRGALPVKGLQFNAQAMDPLRVKAQKTSQEIDCIEKLVQR